MTVFRLLKLPDFVSLVNLLFGMAAVFFAFGNSYSIAAACLLIAAAADGADGYLARKISGGPLGAHLDSLVDTVSFGIAPAVLLYCMSGSFFAILAVCFYVICGILRLARYNAFPSKNPEYSGIPITGACVFIASFVIFFDRLVHFSFEIPYILELLCVLMILLSILMVSTVPYPKVMKKFSFVLLIILFSATILSLAIESIYVIIFPGIMCCLMLIYLFAPLAGLILKTNPIHI
jgi:Phosphatidylserine synthase